MMEAQSGYCTFLCCAAVPHLKCAAPQVRRDQAGNPFSGYGLLSRRRGNEVWGWGASWPPTGLPCRHLWSTGTTTAWLQRQRSTPCSATAAPAQRQRSPNPRHFGARAPGDSTPDLDPPPRGASQMHSLEVEQSRVSRCTLRRRGALRPPPRLSALVARPRHGCLQE